ncbi:MAG: ATP-binding protein [Caldilineaceae bacterium]
MDDLYIVTGAPGAGKSTAVAAFLQLTTDSIAFDMDWLATPASLLAGKSIYTDPTTWPPYNALWFEILHTIHRNGKTPVLFAPLDPDDITISGKPSWCREIRWLLLDCDDATRHTRLAARPDWTATMVAEALTDAQHLREQIRHQLDTGHLSPTAVATGILEWLAQS